MDLRQDPLSVMMSDMKGKAASTQVVRRQVAAPMEPNRVFTVRDLNRQPQAVLNAARKAGGVPVRSRSGERFLVKRIRRSNPRCRTSNADVHSTRGSRKCTPA